MNWEPMTEEAEFEDGREYLLASHLHKYNLTQISKAAYEGGSFWINDVEFEREHFEHFCRITNPNEVKP